MHRLHLLWFALSAPNEWSLIVKHIFSYFVLKAFFFFMLNTGSIFLCGFTAQNTLTSNSEVRSSVLLHPDTIFLICIYRHFLKCYILINTMIEKVRNTWRNKGTCICWEWLMYHSYYWFTIYSHTNHRCDILPKILCGQNERWSRFTDRC